MANETFTMTLDNVAESVSVTIVDTSQSPQSGSELFTTNGTFTVPANVTRVDIFMVGGGGGGQCGQYSYGSGGGGGGGGACFVESYTVTPGDTFAVEIGAGGTGGSVSTNSPFETVNGSSQKYPQTGTVTNATNGGTTKVKHDVAGETDTWSFQVYGGQGAPGTGGGGGGGGQMPTTSLWATGKAGTVTAPTPTAGNGVSRSGATLPGGGGGCWLGGNGGTGKGDFYRSGGGYNYYKASPGGDGGGQSLSSGTTNGTNGSNAPALYNYGGGYNYTGAGDGGVGGDANQTGYGGGGGGGAGGLIRNQTIITGITNTYRWFLGHSGQNGSAGAVRFAWGS